MFVRYLSYKLGCECNCNLNEVEVGKRGLCVYRKLEIFLGFRRWVEEKDEICLVVEIEVCNKG